VQYFALKLLELTSVVYMYPIWQGSQVGVLFIMMEKPTGHVVARDSPVPAIVKPDPRGKVQV
jgi:hypothetical protein